MNGRMILAAALWTASLACGTGREESDCASQMWPRVIVGVVPASGSARDGVTLVHARARLATGEILDGNPHGCPEVREVVCTYSFFTAPRDREVTLLIQRKGDPADRAEKRIPLPPFTHAGRDITYVVVTLPSEGSAVIGEPRLIHPCPR